MQQDVGILILVHLPFIEAVRIQGITSQEGYDHVRAHVRIGGDVPHDARHGEVPQVVPPEDLPHGIVGAEILEGHFLRDHDRIRFGQRGPGIAGDEGNGKHVQQGRIGPDDLLLVETLFLMHEEPGRCRASHPGEAFDFREITLQDGSPSRWRSRRPDGLTGAFNVIDDPVDPVGMGMISIIAQLVPDVEQDQHAGRQPDREPHDVDERVGWIP